MTAQLLPLRREWSPLCERIARTATQGYYLPSGDDDDLLQESRIGVAAALRDYKPGRGSFVNFALLCARRSVISAVRRENCGKQTPLNGALSFATVPAMAEDGVTLGDLFYHETDDPAVIVVALDEARRLLRRIARLSSWERECVERVLFAGEPYGNVGREKSVDNAIQRARHKLAAAREAA